MWRFHSAKVKLDALIKIDSEDDSLLTFTKLKEDQAQLKIDSILNEIQKYKNLIEINIPHDIESFGSRKLFEKYYNRTLTLSPSHLKNISSCTHHTYLAIFCLIKKQMMTDTLTDLLLKLLKRILTKAERSVDKGLWCINSYFKRSVVNLIK